MARTQRRAPAVARQPRRKQAQPKRRPQARARIVRARNVIPKGLSSAHHFDAFGEQRPQALAFAVGPSTHISGLNRTEVIRAKSATAGDGVLVMFSPGGGESVFAYRTKIASSWSAAWVESDLPTSGITGTPSATSPKYLMCTRGSVRTRVTSAAGEISGPVFVLNTTQSLASSSAGELDELVNFVHTRSTSVEYGSSELTITHQWDSIPVDQTSYSNFRFVDTTLNMAASVGLPLSTILFWMPSNDSQAATFSFSFAATYYAKYDTVGPLANMAMKPPAISQAAINAARDLAMSVGSLGRPLMVNAAQGMLGAVPGMLGNLFREAAPVVRARPLLALGM